jgi:hypothetical protein
MTRETKLNELDALFADLSYPVGRSAVVEEYSDVTVQLADGSVNLGAVLERSTVDSFASPEDLRGEVMTHLPQNAVGEPYQSEGEG